MKYFKAFKTITIKKVNLKDQMNRQVKKKEQEIKESDGSFEEENYNWNK